MAKRQTRILVSVLLNIFFTIFEAAGGLWTNSLAILSDALHDFGDSVVLGSSYLLERGANRSPDSRRTFGYQRLSLFSALFSGMVLVGGSLIILFQAIPRLFNPEMVNSTGMFGIAIIGILVNSIGVILLKKGASLNERVLSWHLLEDVLGWLVILIGSLLIYFWEFYLIDPIMTLGLTIFILYNVSKNLKEAINILLEGVPKHISYDNVKRALLSIDGVIGLHEIHIWSLEGETDMLTGHVVLDKATFKAPEETRKRIKNVLKEHHIEHSTIEIESQEFCSGIECKDWNLKNDH